MDDEQAAGNTVDRGITGDAAAFVSSAGKGAASAVEGIWSFVKAGVEGDYLLLTDSETRAAAWDKATSMASKAADYGSAALDDPMKPIRDARDTALSAYNSFDEARLKAAAQGQSAEFWGNIVGKSSVGVAAAAVTGGLGGAAEGAAVEGAEGLAGSAARGLKQVAESTEAEVAEGAAGTAAKVIENPAVKLSDAPASQVTDCPLKVDSPPSPGQPNGKSLAESWYTDNYTKFRLDPAKTASHLKGIDFEKPVTIKLLEPGSEIIEYQRIGGTPGIYKGYSGTTPSEMGIDAQGRILRRYRVSTPTEVLETTAAPFPSGEVQGVGGSGGGKQLTMPPDWERNVGPID